MSRFHTDPWVNIVDPGDETVEVRRMNWRSFRTLILREPKASSLDLVDKMCYLLSFCSVLNSAHHIYGLWMQLNENEIAINVKLIISLSHYMSNTTMESTIQRTQSQCSQRVYFLIQMFEENGFNKGPLLTLRVDRFAEFGELVWLQRGYVLSGKTMLRFCIDFIEYLAIKSCYLMDSAQINLSPIPFAMNNDDPLMHFTDNKDKYKQKHKHKVKKGYLRLLHVLTYYNEDTVDDGEGLTWYESNGLFKRINIKKWPLVSRNGMQSQTQTHTHTHTTLSQNIQHYESSIRFVRQFELSEIIQYLSLQNQLHLKAMITYYKEFEFDHDTKQRINKEMETKTGKNRERNRDRSRSRSRGRNRLKLSTLYSRLPLQTVHDLCRRVHCSALYAPTKWRKLLGQRHLRILYDLLIDPKLIVNTKKNGFLLDDKGRKYLNALQEIMNVRVYCRGQHKNDRIDGVMKAKAITKHEINKFMSSFESNVDIYREERERNRMKYRMYIDDHKEDDVVDEIRFSLNIKNNNCNSYKHEISIDSNSRDNNHEIEIRVKSSSRKRRRSRRLSSLRRSATKSSDDDDDI